MKLYLLTQTDNRGYDTFDSCVVCAPSEEEAREIHPRGDRRHAKGRGWFLIDDLDLFDLRTWVDCGGWVEPGLVTATLIGVADAGLKPGVVLASFHAG